MGKTTLSVETRTESDGTVVVTPVGAAGLGGAEELERQLTKVTATKPPRVVFDLSKLTFISSMGITVLVAFHREVTGWKGAMTLSNPTDDVAAVLRRVRLDELFVITPPAGGKSAKGSQAKR